MDDELDIRCITNSSTECLDEPDSTSEDYPDLSQILYVRVIFIVLYFIVGIMSVLGNAGVVITVMTNRKMQTVVNYYIVNLAICDFMVGIFVLPVKLLELTAPASWGALNDGLCTTVLYAQTVIVFASVLTLVATSIERYLAIVHPLESRMQQSKSRTVKILMIVWLLPCLGAIPFLYPSRAAAYTLESSYGSIERLTCSSNFAPSFRKIYFTFLFVVFYVLPLSFITWTCSRIAICLLQTTSTTYREGSLRRQDANRRKVAKMILMVVVAFAISWTPYFLVTIITQYSSVNYMEKHNFFFTMLFINFFAFLNSSVNPIIYAIMSTRFRTGFTQILRFILCVSCGDHSRPPSVNGLVRNGHENGGILDELDPETRRREIRKRGTSLAMIGKYHRRMVLLACGGPSHVSTDSCPTDSGHENQSRKVNLEVRYRPTDEKATIETMVTPTNVNKALVRSSSPPTTASNVIILNGHANPFISSNLSYSSNVVENNNHRHHKHVYVKDIPDLTTRDFQETRRSLTMPTSIDFLGQSRARSDPSLPVSTQGEQQSHHS